MTAKEYTNEIVKQCDELIQAAQAIAQLPPVSFLNKSSIQWTGIIGAIQETRESNRLRKLINTPIYNGLSFYQLAGHIIESANELVEKQIEVQKQTTKNDLAYYDNIRLIISSIQQIITSWYNYSPEMAEVGLTIGKEKNVSLFLSVDYQTKEAFKKMDLPEDIEIKHHPNNEDSNSGCFGIFIGMIVLSSALIYCIA